MKRPLHNQARRADTTTSRFDSSHGRIVGELPERRYRTTADSASVAMGNVGSEAFKAVLGQMLT